MFKIDIPIKSGGYCKGIEEWNGGKGFGEREREREGERERERQTDRETDRERKV